MGSAIQQMEPPRNSAEVRRFFGRVNYLSKFLPNISALGEPLRRLINLLDDEFCWGRDQEQAFEKLKQMTSSETMLRYYDPNLPVVLQQSSVGLGAVLLQQGRPVAYASRALTDCERNYAPLELECLAIVFATKKFDQYVFGHPDVTIHTDHRPLEAILHRSLLRAPKRLQAMILSLQRYTLKVVYKPGTEQVIADMLSQSLSKDGGKGTLVREHVSQTEAQEEVLRRFNIPDPTSDKYVSDARHQAIRRDTPTDQTLKRVAEVITAGWPRSIDQLPQLVRPYWTWRDELTILDGILYKGTRIIIPKSLQRDVIDRLHSSHQGTAATLRRARNAVYWETMAEDIKRFTENCKACLKDTPEQCNETLRQHTIPDIQGSKIGLDIFTSKDAHYLVLVDYLTDFIDFEKLLNLSSESVIDICKRSFARFGILDIVQTDNGPQFTSREFDSFRIKWEFSHSTSSPYRAQSNGKAEDAVETAKRLLKRSTDPYLALLEQRNTATAGMSTSPAQRQIGRSTRSIVPQIRCDDGCATIMQEKAHKRANIQRRYNKSATDLPAVAEGTSVLLRDFVSHKQKWKDAKVVKRLSERSYVLYVDGETVRRNRQYFRPISEDFQSDKQNASTSEAQPSNLPQQSSTEADLEIVRNRASSDQDRHVTPSTTDDSPVSIPSPAADVTSSPVKTTRSSRVIRRPARFNEP